MRVCTLLGRCALILFAMPTAWSFGDDLNSISGLVDQMSSSLKSLDGNSALSCPKEPFTDPKDLAHFICQNRKAIPREELKKEALLRGRAMFTSGLGNDLTQDRFWERLDFFTENQEKLTKQMNEVPATDWPVHTGSVLVNNCRYQKNSSAPVQTMKFKNLSFVAVSHFSNLNDQLEGARKALLQRLQQENPDAILLEGYPLGMPVPCEEVVGAVLTSDSNLHTESEVLLKFGFIYKKALVAADNQQITDSVTKLMFRGDSSKAFSLKKDLAFVDVLHVYGELLRLTPLKDPLDQAISSVNLNSKLNPPLSAEGFRKRYRDLNQRELPMDRKEIYTDYTPSEYLSEPKGTNLLIDKENNFRNQTLLRAIQLSITHYSKPMVVYGSGHLPGIGSTLAQQLGAPTNIDFVGACP